MLLIHILEPRWLYTTYLDGNAQADTTNHGRSDQCARCWKIDRRWGITGLKTRVAEVGGPPPQVIIAGAEEWEDRSGVITREAEVILLAGGDGCPCALYVPSAVSRSDSSV